MPVKGLPVKGLSPDSLEVIKLVIGNLNNGCRIQIRLAIKYKCLSRDCPLTAIKKGRQVPPPNSKSKYLRAITALIGILTRYGCKGTIFLRIDKILLVVCAKNHIFALSYEDDRGCSSHYMQGR